MPTSARHDLRDAQKSALLQNLIGVLSPDLISNPQLGEVMNQIVDDLLSQDIASQVEGDQTADGGLADLIGLGRDAPDALDQTQIPSGIENYDDIVSSKRIHEVADLYYIFMHERIGVFRVMDKLLQLFRAGTLRISSDAGAYGLYRYEKHNLLRYRMRDRLRAYRRVFGYTCSDPGPGARANPEFHGLFRHFIAETAKYWRDKRISEVIRHNATDPTFGSIAIVRRAGLDLRNNLKNSSYGYIAVLRNETSQALAECMKVLEAPDIKAQFGANTAWDVIELVLWQYFHEPVFASTLNHMAVAGREVIGWLADPYILQTNRAGFETSLNLIAESAEEWLSSEQGIRMSRPTPPARGVYMPGPPPASTLRS